MSQHYKGLRSLWVDKGVDAFYRSTVILANINIILMLSSQIKSGEQEVSSLYLGTEDFRVSYKPEKKRQEKSSNNYTKWFAILFVGLVIFSFYRVQTRDRAEHISTDKANNGEQNKLDEIKVKIDTEANSRTPRILWVLTSIELEGLRMTESLAAKHLIHVGKKSGFDVRIVNSYTAYDWLSPEMTEIVRKTKHTSKYILSVHQLLRIALLVEHGGLSVRLPRYLFVQNFDWIIELFDQKLQDLMRNQQVQNIEYCSSGKEPQVMMFYDKKRDYKIYEDWFLYARKDSVLLRETLIQMCKILTEGTWQLKYFLNIEQMDQEVSVKYFKNMFIDLVNFRQYYWYTGDTFCQNYQVLSINKNSGPYIIKIENQDTVRSEFQIDKQEFFVKYGRKYIVETDLNNLHFQFLQVLNKERLGVAHQNSILRSDLIEIERNQWMLTPVKKNREVSYCIISLKPLTLQNYETSINESLKYLNQQTFKKWKALYFVAGLQRVNTTLSYAPITLINASQYEGLNLQRATIKYCEADDVGVILNYDETFGHKSDLSSIAEKISNRSIYGAILSIKYDNNIIKPKFIQNNVRRKVQEPNVTLFQQIAHNFRVFSIYSYKSIPHMALHDNYGRYYDRQVPFLTLLEMAWDYNKCDDSEMIYHTKKVEQKIEIPKYRIVLFNTFINMPSLKEIDIKKHQYFTKYAARTLCGAMNLYLDRKGRSLQYFFILNNGSQFVGFQDRKDMPKIMDNKIHQMWVGGEMPKFKKFLTDKNKENHPNFQYYLWTNDNITRDNFPVSYDLIKSLMEFNKISKYNKLSMVSDLMRAEIIYNHGGVYIDTNYLVFNKNALDDWLTYKGMFITQLFPYHRFQREGTVFAAMKGFDRVKRLVDHRAISTRNHYSKQAHIEAGPTFFTHTVLGQQQLDPDILQPSFEYLYPYYPWEDSNYKNLCEADAKIKPEDILFKNKLTYRKDCQQLYPWAIGMDYWSQGKTWG